MPENAALSDQDLIDYLKNDLGVDDTIGADTALFSSGMLDSVGMMGLITFLEEKCRIDVRPADVTLEHFDTVARMLAYAASLA